MVKGLSPISCQPIGKRTFTNIRFTHEHSDILLTRTKFLGVFMFFSNCVAMIFARMTKKLLQTTGKSVIKIFALQLYKYGA